MQAPGVLVLVKTWADSAALTSGGPSLAAGACRHCWTQLTSYADCLWFAGCTTQRNEWLSESHMGKHCSRFHGSPMLGSMQMLHMARWPHAAIHGISLGLPAWLPPLLQSQPLLPRVAAVLLDWLLLLLLQALLLLLTEGWMTYVLTGSHQATDFAVVSSKLVLCMTVLRSVPSSTSYIFSESPA